MGKKDSSIEESIVQGFIDSIDGLYINGWAFNPKNPEEKIELIVIVDEKIVATGIADRYREDLKQAGIGNGEHAFSIKIPNEYADGKEHIVKIVTKKYGQKLNGSDKKFIVFGKYKSEITGLIDWHIEGKIINLEDPNKIVEIELYENEKLIANAFSNPNDNGKFEIWLPPEVLDGNSHYFVIRTKVEKIDIGHIVDITPPYITPYDVLEKHSKDVPYKLNPLARERYEALKNNIFHIINNKKIKQEEIKFKLLELYKVYNIVNQGWENLKKYPVLEFPKFEKPQISIVIPVHNKFPLTYSCLASILLSTYNIEYEVIIVDDGSNDETINLKNFVSNVKYVRNDTSQGFILSCNKGASIAKGDYIVLLNNDTEVLDKTFSEMLFVFENFNKVGLVGSKLLYPDLTLQEAGAIVWGNGQAWNYGRNQNPAHPKYNYTREVDYCSGACIMIPKKLWNDLGGFDEEFIPAYWEETDLAFRVKEKGYKVVYSPFSQIIHYEGMSAGKDPKSGGMKRYQTINQKKFRKKWSQQLSKNIFKYPSLELADLAKDGNVTGRILAIDYELPRPDKEAGGYATFQELRLFKSLGYKVTFVPNNMAYLYGYVEDLQKSGVEVVYAPYYSSVKEFIEKNGKEFDIFYLVRWYIAQEYVDLIRQVNPNAKILFNNADLHFLRELREAIANKDNNLLKRALDTQKNELEVMKKVDLVLSYNEVEHAVILSHNQDKTKVAKWPWVVCTKEKEKAPFENREHLCFLGNYRHLPNIFAVEYFVREIMPIIREEIPGIKFFIYGANITDEIKKLESDDVIVKGYIKDLKEMFTKHKIFVAPLISGAGIKGKVIEALSYGVPSVLTPIAVEGMNVKNNHEVLIADSPEEFAKAIYSLYTNKDLWEKISNNALEFVKNEYSFSKGQELVKKALEMVDIFVPDNTEGLHIKRCIL